MLFLAGGIALLLGVLYSRSSADLSTQDIQPVSFSHKRHAGALQIACPFCHRYAAGSRVAGIPSVYLCMTCHASLKRRLPETEALLIHWNKKEPIPWVRLQRLPDHVYFTHEMHLNAGLKCADCHGEVDQMTGTPRAATYEMGWCLTCHREQGASDDCWTCHK